MPLSLNTYDMAVVQGQLDFKDESSVITAMVDKTISATLVPGQPVKPIATSNGLLKVVPLAANTDISCGFISYTPKDGSFTGGKPFELAMTGAIMWMTSGAAIVAGAQLEVVYTTNKVITNAGTNPVMGTAIDAATAADQLIKVKIKTPSSL